MVVVDVADPFLGLFEEVRKTIPMTTQGDHGDHDDVADLLAALLGLGLLGQTDLSRRPLAGSLLAGHGPRPYPPADGRVGSGGVGPLSRERAAGAINVEEMPVVVQKFGGTSVGDADRIRAVADHIARTRREGTDVVAVVSAMGKTTDDLIHLANSVSSVQPPREYDMLVSTGERISMSLLCMALAELGVDAASFTGSQVGIITDNDHTRAKILEVKARPPARGLGGRAGPGGGGLPGGVDRP